MDPSTDLSMVGWIVLGHGVHLIDTLRFLGGPIEAVSATVSSKCASDGTRGTSVYADGAVGTFQLTGALTMDWTEGLHVHGERGSIEARTGSPHWKSGAEVSLFDTANEEYRIPTTPDSDPYERQLEGFAGAILGSFDVSRSGHDGLHDRRVPAATSKSLGTGTRVSV